MHEFSLATDLLNLARREARKAGLIRIDNLFVQIGNIGGVSIDALEFAYSFLREEDEITKNAELIVERIDGVGKCRSCGGEFQLDFYYLFCPKCSTPTIDIISGREFMLVSIEGEESEEENPIDEKPGVTYG